MAIQQKLLQFLFRDLIYRLVIIIVYYYFQTNLNPLLFVLFNPLLLFIPFILRSFLFLSIVNLILKTMTSFQPSLKDFHWFETRHFLRFFLFSLLAQIIISSLSLIHLFFFFNYSFHSKYYLVFLLWIYQKKHLVLRHFQLV